MLVSRRVEKTVWNSTEAQSLYAGRKRGAFDTFCKQYTLQHASEVSHTPIWGVKDGVT